MFVWDKSIRRIETDVTNVVQLFRSMRDVQMALPGLPVQEASAYLCQYRDGSEIVTVAAFHMQKSQQLAFYVSKPNRVAESQADEMFNSGLGFVETMGFLLCDMDLGLLDGQDRAMLWESLPIFLGEGVEKQAVPSPSQPASVAAKTEPVKPASPVPSVAKPEAVQPRPEPVPVVQAPPVAEKVVSVEPVHTSIVEEDGPEVDDSVDDLLAAVEALRAKRPGMQTRRSSLKPAEMQKRRIELRQNVGRILVSL